MHPPPDLPWPDDRPVHGADGGDAVEEVFGGVALAEVTPVVLGFRAAGYPLAYALADFYLSNPPEGSSYVVQTDDVERVVQAAPKVTADQDNRWHKYDGQDLIGCAIREILDEAYHNAEYSGKYDEEQSIAPRWMPAGKLYGTGDLENALGGFYMTVGADITVLKAQRGRSASYRMTYRAYIFDQYFFHDTATKWYGREIDHAMSQLEWTGHARSFITRGESEIKTREGHY